MAIEAPTSTMTGEEIVALSKAHTLYEWSAQSKVDPIAIARAKGVYFWTPEGKRYLDFNSQLMCVNIGHADDRVVGALQAQLAALPYASPFMATEPRARLGAKLAEVCPGTSTSSSSRTAVPRATRMRSSSRASSRDATKCSHGTARTMARPRARCRSQAIRDAG